MHVEEDAEETGDDRTARKKGQGSRIIGRVLPAAVKIWLRSQVEQVEALSIALEGRDRDIISGYLPGVSISARSAIYKGIYISELNLSAEDIRINIGQVIRGQPLRLLRVFPVRGKVVLSADDLKASVGSALLGEGLNNFWRSLMQVRSLPASVEARYGKLPLQANMTLHNAQIHLATQRLGLSFYPQVAEQTSPNPVILGTGLSVIDGSWLRLDSPRWLQTLADVADIAKGEPVEELEGFQWSLGADTQLSELCLRSEALICRGQIAVRP